MYSISTSNLMYRCEIPCDYRDNYITMGGQKWIDVNVYGHDVWAVEQGGKIWFWNALSPELNALPEKAGLKFSRVSANSRFVWAIQERTGRLHFCRLPCHGAWIVAGHEGFLVKDIDANQDDVVYAVATDGMLWRAEDPISTHGDLADKLCGSMGERGLDELEAYVIANPYLKGPPLTVLEEKWVSESLGGADMSNINSCFSSTSVWTNVRNSDASAFHKACDDVLKGPNQAIVTVTSLSTGRYGFL